MIHPAVSDIPDVGRRSSSTKDNFSGIQRWGFQLLRWWSSANLSYRGGKYSVERLIALEEYTSHCSVLHAVLVCVASFLPANVVLIVQEAVPLQELELGWEANYGFWVRAAVVIGAVFYTVIVQAKYFLQGFAVTRRQQLVAVAMVVVVQMSFAMFVAAKVCFPIPFVVITLVPAFYVVSMGSICIVFGLSVLREVWKNRDRLARFGAFIAAQQFMALIYPAYQVLFHAASNTNYELPAILLLPVIKLIVKNISLRCVAHLEDMMPEGVIFTVDFFNAVYMATSMESAKSMYAIVIIVVLDVIQSATVIFRLHRRTKTVLERLNAARKTPGSEANFLKSAYQLCCCEDDFKRQNRQRIRVRSCLRYNLSQEAIELLDQREMIPIAGNAQAHRRYTAPEEQASFPEKNLFEKRQKIIKGATWAHRHLQATISPAPALNSARLSDKLAIIPRRYSSVTTPHKAVLQEALEILFTTECLLLSALLDAAVPFFYGIFMFGMVHFQSAKYHTELSGVTEETIGGVVDSIFIFSIVELVAFTLLAWLIYRNLKINALYHVAFVLETQTELIQSKLLAWVAMTLAFRVVHFGIDFTFQFAWLANSSE